jgi:hypothetical protein
MVQYRAVRARTVRPGRFGTVGTVDTVRYGTVRYAAEGTIRDTVWYSMIWCGIVLVI